MTSPLTPSAEIVARAEALKRLRKRAGAQGEGISQEQAAINMGQRKQSWQAYEAAQRQAIMRTDVQDRLTRALGFTRTDLDDEVAAILGEPVERRFEASEPSQPRAAHVTEPTPSYRHSALTLPVFGRAKGGPRGAHIYEQNEPERWLDLGALYGPSSRAMQLIDDSVYPWAASGITIVYDLDRSPRKDQGCVIETKSQGYFVKLFDHQDGEKVYVRELQPQERLIDFDLADVVGVYAVLDRIDR